MYKPSEVTGQCVILYWLRGIELIRIGYIGDNAYLLVRMITLLTTQTDCEQSV